MSLNSFGIYNTTVSVPPLEVKNIFNYTDSNGLIQTTEAQSIFKNFPLQRNGPKKSILKTANTNTSNEGTKKSVFFNPVVKVKEFDKNECLTFGESHETTNKIALKECNTENTRKQFCRRRRKVSSNNLPHLDQSTTSNSENVPSAFNSDICHLKPIITPTVKKNKESSEITPAMIVSRFKDMKKCHKSFPTYLGEIKMFRPIRPHETTKIFNTIENTRKKSLKESPNNRSFNNTKFRNYLTKKFIERNRRKEALPLGKFYPKFKKSFTESPVGFFNIINAVQKEKINFNDIMYPFGNRSYNETPKREIFPYLLANKNETASKPTTIQKTEESEFPLTLAYLKDRYGEVKPQDDWKHNSWSNDIFKDFKKSINWDELLSTSCKPKPINNSYNSLSLSTNSALLNNLANNKNKPNNITYRDPRSLCLNENRKISNSLRKYFSFTNLFLI